MSDKSSGILGLYEGVPIEVLNLPRKDQVLVVKIDIDRYGVNTAQDIFNSIKESLSEDIVLLGIPLDIKLECWNVEDINDHIKYCESIREIIK